MSRLAVQAAFVRFRPFFFRPVSVFTATGRCSRVSIRHFTVQQTIPEARQEAELRTAAARAAAPGKTPEELIAEVPPIVVDGPIARCDGGRGPLGHPVEYIQLNKVHPEQPEVCKYCGLRFIMKDAGHH